jgi:predicted secreted protein
MRVERTVKIMHKERQVDTDTVLCAMIFCVWHLLSHVLDVQEIVRCTPGSLHLGPVTA